MSLRRYLASFVYLVMVFTGALPPVSAPAAQERWLVASDIHFDPYNRSPRPVYYNADSNLALLDSTIAAMRRAEPQPPVILLTGDFLAHHFDRLAAQHHQQSLDAALGAMRVIVRRFSAAFPRTRFIVVIGNNDDPCGDYATTYDSTYLHALARLWAPLVNRGNANPRFVQDFGKGGYYAERYGRLRFLVLNSVYWSFRYRNACSTSPVNPGRTELEWFSSTVTSTPAAEKNFVVMHIPPGVDAGSTYAVHGVAVVPFLNSGANRMLARSLSDPASHVATILAGHAHHTEFRTLGNVPLLIVASISPIYGNSPTFFALQISPSSGIIGNFEAYMYRYGIYDRHENTGITGWERVFTFDTAFDAKSADAATLRVIHERLDNGWRPDPAVEFESDRYSRCAQDELSSSYAACSGVRRHEWIIVVGLSSVLIAVIFCIMWLRRHR